MKKQAFIIALLQQKGGSGKTTTAINIAGGLSEVGYKVLVADMDKDKPDAWSWAAKNESISNYVHQLDEKNYREKLEKLKYEADFIIIDTPPNFQTAALKAALQADFVIIPSAPSGMDLSGLLEAKELAIIANKPYKLVANRVVKNSIISRSLLKEINQDGCAFESFIPQSVKFVEAEIVGKYIGEYAPQSNAHIQVKKLIKEIVEYCKGDLNG